MRVEGHKRYSSRSRQSGRIGCSTALGCAADVAGEALAFMELLEE